MNKFRAVLDTNVIVSALINPAGPPGAVLKALREERFTLVTSRPINEEILEVLNRPCIRDKYGLSEYLFDIAFILFEVAEVIRELPGVKIVKDPDDNKFLSAAIGGSAHYLVTGDAKDLLGLREYKGIQIVTPAQFLEVLNKG